MDTMWKFIDYIKPKLWAALVAIVGGLLPWLIKLYAKDAFKQAVKAVAEKSDVSSGAYQLLAVAATYPISTAISLLVLIVGGAAIYSAVEVNKHRKTEDRPEGGSGAVTPNGFVPREEYERMMRSSTSHETIRDELKKQLHEKDKALDNMTQALLISAGKLSTCENEKDRLNQHIKDLMGKQAQAQEREAAQATKPKLVAVITSSEVTEIAGPSSEPWNGPAIMRPPTSSKIMIRTRLEVSNEHDVSTKILGNSLSVFDHPEGSKQTTGAVSVDAELREIITKGIPREGWMEFILDHTDLQSVVNRNFQVTISDGCKTQSQTPPQRIWRVTQRPAPNGTLSDLLSPPQPTHEN